MLHQLVPMYEMEQQLRQRGYCAIAGVDEAGRGPLAGPVVAAAVILPIDYRNDAIQDSKKLSPLQREHLFEEIIRVAVSYGIGKVSAAHIDKTDILTASKLAMRKAILKLQPLPDFILTDAVPVNIADIPQMPMIDGDARSFVIAAASILAKVTRDRDMHSFHKKHPHYGFDQHMGYGTPIHLKAIEIHGPCRIHRMSFAPLRSIVN
ncbi:ribonuclease HII [Candidatus Peregrinibacteria bacterium]|nr:MAG: ribonuclease HII [Candidatus Peregrinibacteria bacterium]